MKWTIVVMEIDMKSTAEVVSLSVVGSSRSALEVARRDWWIVAIFALLSMLLALGISLSQPRIYESTAALYVTSASDANSSTAYQGSLASQQRVSSYAELATSKSVLAEALRIASVDMSIDEVQSSVSASAAPDTVLLSISAQDRDQAVATKLADAVSAAMVEYVSALEQPSGGGEPLAKLTVVTAASPADGAVSPRTQRNVVMGLVGGLLLGLFVVFARERFDSKIRSQRDLSAVSDVPALGAVPFDSQFEMRPFTAEFATGGNPVAESFRRLRTNLRFAEVDSPARRILVTSPNADEGKTTTALNLAVAIAESGKSVLLVDADLRRPSVSRILGINGDIGLTSLVGGDIDISDACQSIGVGGLSILASGVKPPNPVEILGSRKFEALMQKLGDRFEFVIVDTPPICPVTDASVLGQNVDGALIVCRSGETNKSDLRDAENLLQTAQVRVLGLVLNAIDSRSESYVYGEVAKLSSVD
jgi:capsular exopolysaccharide synthesis family protein